jgi:Raf kinase inhibitor-like YbhB/YbcL family protein
LLLTTEVKTMMRVTLLLLIAVLLNACRPATTTVSAKEKQTMAITVTSTAFHEGETIPKPYTCDGAEQSPPLAWTGIPANAKSIALLVDDPDAPHGTWTHWVLFNLPATEQGLPAGVPKTLTLANGAAQGTNSNKEIGYNGPCPPPGPEHRYYFKVYALDTVLPVHDTPTQQQLMPQLAAHILAEGQLMGRYGR